MSRSTQAPRYGRSAERQIIESNPYVEERSPWHDARVNRGPHAGTPVEVKAAMRRRANGQPGRFRVFCDSHQTLAAEDGFYHLVVYQPSGNGIQILKDRRVRARELKRLEWSPSNHETRQVGGRAMQAKINIGEVF